MQTDKTEIQGAHAQLTGVVGAYDTNIAFSSDYRRESLDSQQIQCNANTCNTSNKFGITDVNKDINIRSYGFEITQPLPYEMTLIAGVGYHQLNKDGGNDDNKSSAQLSLSKAITAQTVVYATTARKVDAPTISQLYDASKGNDSLGFQRANHYELGIKNQWDKASLDLAIYQSRVYDFIEKDDNTNLFMNRQEMLFKGLDVSGMIKPTNDLTLRMSLGLLNSSDESDDTVTKKLQYRPHSKASLEATYDITSQWAVNGSYQRIGEQAHFDKNDPAIHENLSSFELVSLKLSYALPQQLGSVYVGADNLFDEDYSTSYGFPQAGRFFYTGMKVDWK